MPCRVGLPFATSPPESGKSTPIFTVVISPPPPVVSPGVAAELAPGVAAPGVAAPVVGAVVAVPPPVLHAAANMSAAPKTPRYLSFMCAITSSGNSSSMRPRHLRSAFASFALNRWRCGYEGQEDRRDPDRWPDRYLPAHNAS